MRNKGRAPVLSLLEKLCLFDLHDFDMVKIFGATTDYFAKRIDFALLDDPRLGARDDALGGPPWEGASLEDEPSGEKRARVSLPAVDDVAGDDVRGVWVGITQKEREGDY